MPETSEETQRYFKLEKCSNCGAPPYSGKWTKKPNYQLSRRDGTPIPWVNAQPKNNKRKLAQTGTLLGATTLGVIFPPALGVAGAVGAGLLVNQRRMREVQHITCTNCDHRWS